RRSSDLMDEPGISGVKYKSLNANIARDRMEPIVDSLKVLKGNARKIATTINSSSDSSVQAENMAELNNIQSQISDLQNRLVIEITKSNTAEISYFQNSNNALISRLKEFETKVSTENLIKSY